LLIRSAWSRPNSLIISIPSDVISRFLSTLKFRQFF
jgi:hypothetical protein